MYKSWRILTQEEILQPFEASVSEHYNLSDDDDIDDSAF